MTTIKIIDLLNLIANNEYDKLPNKIKVDDKIFELDKNVISYYDYDNIPFFCYISATSLNCEVEAIDYLGVKEVPISNSYSAYKKLLIENEYLKQINDTYKKIIENNNYCKIETVEEHVDI